MKRRRPTVRAQRELIKALRDLIEAWEIQGQPFGDARVSPQSPGGQSTATLPDGRKVCRRAHASAMANYGRKVIAMVEGRML